MGIPISYSLPLEDRDLVNLFGFSSFQKLFDLFTSLLKALPEGWMISITQETINQQVTVV